MGAVEKWSKGRFEPVAMFATVAAGAVVDGCELIRLGREHGLICGLNAKFASEDWLACYRRPSAVIGALLQAHVRPETPIAEARYRLRFRRLRAFLRENMREVVTERVRVIAEPNAEGIANIAGQDFKLDLLRLEKSGTADGENVAAYWLQQTQFVFYLNVMLPCWLEYHCMPWDLYRRACRGEFEAIESLLRLDPETASAARIRRQLFELRWSNTEQHRHLLNVQALGRANKFDVASLKYAVGGLLLKWSDQLHRCVNGGLAIDTAIKCVPEDRRNDVRRALEKQLRLNWRTPIRCRLNAPDIQNLFHAIAEDATQGKVDPDFVGHPNSIYKRLERKSRGWPDLWKADISRAA